MISANPAKKIYIIEDDANFLYSLQARFRVAGFEVFTCEGDESAEEILEKLKDGRPDYLVLDLILPKADGFKVLSLIKSDPALAGITVFVFTDLSDRESREKGLNLGAKEYIIKSQINLDDFAGKIEKIIYNRGKTDRPKETAGRYED